MKIAICPGSFDPVTNGHLDVIERAAGLFDKVIVVVMVNAAKSPLFTNEQRVDMLRRCTAHLTNVEIDCFDGL
ncbi:MAG: pantetheine-phosphate adenylyltransferase, partial [Acutalibacteraceae bacterium]